VKNDYGTEKDARALNGLEEPLKEKAYTLIVLHYFWWIRMSSNYLNNLCH
jgi:hypothetical protein